MQELDAVGLRQRCADPMVRHHLDPDRVVRAWVEGGAAVVEQPGGWPDAPAEGAALLCVGRPDALGPLMARVASTVVRPWRVVVESSSTTALPGSWRPERSRAWHWMLADTPPPPGRGPVEVLDAQVDGDAIDAVLAATNPGSSSRRDLGSCEWLGVRHLGAVVAVGSLTRRASGSGHLGGIGVLPPYRRRGLGTSLTGELARRAADPTPHLATLGVYADNEAAIATYRRLGFGVVHTFVSGLVAG